MTLIHLAKMMSKIDVEKPVDGILLVNKPQGMTSNALLQKVKRLFKAKKAGHTGSLDPLATGMLPVCFGEATKFCQYLLNADKCYEATGILGIKTNTGDALGEITETAPVVDCTRQDLERVFNQFLGSTQQIPSMFSALKHKGTPLYKYAREGITINRDAREITIHQLELIGFDGKHFDIKVNCSKGTYIRNLVEDIGETLMVGAHVTRLHRNYTAGFADEKMYSLEELENKSLVELFACLLPMERAVNYLAVVKLNNNEIMALRQGKILNKDYLPSLKGCVRLHDEDTQFLGLGEIDDSGHLSVRRLLAFSSMNCKETSK